MSIPFKRAQPKIKNGDIRLVYIGLLCQVKTELKATREMMDDIVSSLRDRSGTFDTNELVLELTIIAYNILRMIGQESLNSSFCNCFNTKKSL